MKRFTETTKWDDPWYRKLKPKWKAFWLFLWDKCDATGVWIADIEIAVTYVGEKLDEAEALKIFAGRVSDIGLGRWLLVDFVTFQNGVLSPQCHPHKRIIESLKAHNLTITPEGKTTPPTTLVTSLPTIHPPTLVGEEEDEEGEGDKEVKGGPGEKPKPPEPKPDPAEELRKKAVDVLTFLNAETGQNFRMIEGHLESIRIRISEVDGDIDGIKTMIRKKWAEAKGTDAERWVNPETMFRPKNCNRWYDQRNQPVQRSETNHANHTSNPQFNGNRRTSPADERNSRITGAESVRAAIRAEEANPKAPPWAGGLQPRVQSEAAAA